MAYENFVANLADVVTHNIEMIFKEMRELPPEGDIAACVTRLSTYLTIFYRAKLVNNLISIMMKSTDPYVKDQARSLEKSVKGATVETIKEYLNCKKCFKDLYPKESEWLADFFIDIEPEK